MSEQETRARVLRDVKILAEKLGRVPRVGECRIHIKGFKYQQYKNFDGSYEKILFAAGVTPEKKLAQAIDVVHPFIPPDDKPVHQLIQDMCDRFEKRKDSYEAKKWMEFKVNTDLPIGINVFGDPHVDDDGCNWPLLKKHIDICKQPGVYGMNIGDTHNNWVGRLMKEYANQSTTRSTAWKFIDWFFRESGVTWLVILLGNHDGWNFGSETMSKICENLCTMVDWRAQFVLKFKNGVEFRIDAAHDHTGQSQWNSLHAQQKASTMGGTAHLYIAGHRHNWAIAQHECPHTNRIYHLARARGYKEIDDYSDKLGFGAQKNGASIFVVIDPTASEINRCRVFADPIEGAEYLAHLRARKK